MARCGAPAPVLPRKAADHMFWQARTRDHMCGTLLALVTLGTPLHPAVARAFAAAPRRRGHASEHVATANAAPEGVGDPAIG